MEETEWNVLESIGVGRGYVEYVAVWKGNEKEQELGHDNICHRQKNSSYSCQCRIWHPLFLTFDV